MDWLPTPGSMTTLDERVGGLVDPFPLFGAGLALTILLFTFPLAS